MKNTGEFNEIKISNPDGFIQGRADNGLRALSNDRPSFVSEAPMGKQTEVGKSSESFDVSKTFSKPVGQSSPSLSNTITADNLSSFTSTATNAASGSASAAASAASTTATTAASSAAASAGAAAGAASGAVAGAVSVTTTLGGTIGAVAGVVASTVATAAIVVAVFVSTLTINLSLIMADINSIVVQILMTGAQEQDFETNIIAVLDGKDGTHIVQNVTAETLYLTFSGLAPNTEYTIRIQNDEKLFDEKTFITAKTSEMKGSITAYVQDSIVYISVQNVVLRSGEFYTVLVKDEDGKTVFGVDSTESNATFSFALSSPKALYFTVSVGDEVYSVYQMEAQVGPQYDYEHPTWNWQEDYSAATVSFAETNGGEALVKPAEVTSVTTPATCEADGNIVYTASVSVNDNDYSDSQTVVLTATGHAYADTPEWEWTDTGEVDEEGLPIYTAVAVFACANDPSHALRYDATEMAWDEYFMPDCEEDGSVTFFARIIYNDEELEGTKTVTLPATGHAWGEPVWNWIDTGDGPTATVTFTCSNNEDHVEVLDAVVGDPIEAAATCETGATNTYNGTVTFGGVDYQDSHEVVIGTPLGHSYGEPEWEWIDTGEVDEEGTPIYQAFAVFTCTNDPTHVERIESVGDDLRHEGGVSCEDAATVVYYASVVFGGEDYEGEHEVEVPAAGHNYMPVFHWIYDGEQYEVEFYMVCTREDSNIGPLEVEIDISEVDDYTVYTATVTYEDVEYSEQKKVSHDGTYKDLAVGVNYFIGDTIALGGDTVYFTDDYDGSHRSNMSGDTNLNGVLRAGETGGVTFSSDNEAVLEYDRISFNNDQYARMTDEGYLNGIGYEETSWIFTASEDNLIGVTITGGSGTEADPYVLSALYGVTVTYDANDGIFGVVVTQATSLTQYYTAQEVAEGVYANPPAENPEADGRLFIGWYTDQYHENKFDFDTMPITETITLYAGWLAI